jgi:UDP-glucose 4-epimerase
MQYNVLITGGSGYLGGTLLHRLKSAGLHNIDKLFALVRTSAQAEAVGQYSAEPLVLDIKDEAAIHDSILKHKINVVFSLFDAYASTSQEYFIKALGDLKKTTGRDVHFLHVGPFL